MLPSICFFFFFFFFNDTATTEIYTSIDTLSLHDALPICGPSRQACYELFSELAFRSLVMEYRSEEHTSELQSPIDISYAVFCLKKKKKKKQKNNLLHNIIKEKTL